MHSVLKSAKKGENQIAVECIMFKKGKKQENQRYSRHIAYMNIKSDVELEIKTMI